MILRTSKALNLATAFLLVACGSSDPDTGETTAAIDVSEASDLRAIASDTYVYGLPFVVGYKTLYNYAVNSGSPDYKGPFNEVSCEARLFTPDDAAIVTPNADTPYCMFWLDLRAEPLVLSVPELEPERFYHFQLIDLYTHNYAYVGTLTTGNDAGNFLLAGPDWTGVVPDNIEQLLRSETDLIFIVVRTRPTRIRRYGRASSSSPRCQ